MNNVNLVSWCYFLSPKFYIMYWKMKETVPSSWACIQTAINAGV
jgi:TRAP-type mannitol/chloroaromatic compound transport system permease small subunit